MESQLWDIACRRRQIGIEGIFCGPTTKDRHISGGIHDRRREPVIPRHLHTRPDILRNGPGVFLRILFKETDLYYTCPEDVGATEVSELKIANRDEPFERAVRNLEKGRLDVNEDCLLF